MNNKTIELLAKNMPKLYPVKDNCKSNEYIKVMEYMFDKSLDKTIQEFFKKND